LEQDESLLNTKVVCDFVSHQAGHPLEVEISRGKSNGPSLPSGRFSTSL
jgi:hypothetical protein